MGVLLIPFKLVISIVCFVLKIVFKLLSLAILVVFTPFVLVATYIGVWFSGLSVIGIIAAWVSYKTGTMDLSASWTITIFSLMFSALLLFSSDICDFLRDKADDISDFFGDIAEEIWW